MIKNNEYSNVIKLCPDIWDLLRMQTNSAYNEMFVLYICGFEFCERLSCKRWDKKWSLMLKFHKKCKTWKLFTRPNYLECQAPLPDLPQSMMTGLVWSNKTQQLCLTRIAYV